ncbi:unnamed protein product [Hymenolepis diminuta]|uniref:Uncharacterized protein n=1 Tax=Hymenolepis diminuta TaxID=6216 RepID=A0A564Y7J6_HYMDI|nr:unnamed protein product [Hymenolepis diminuta]
MHFPELPFIRILHANTSVFRPRSWSDLIYVPMTHNPCLSDMSKRVHRFPLFSITASLHIKGTSALMLWCGLTQVTHIKLPLFFQTTHIGQCGLLHVLFISSFPQHAALPLSVTHCGFLEYMFGLLNSWC